MFANMTIIGANVKRARELNGFSQANVAGFLKVDQSIVASLENSECPLQSNMLERLANLYGYKVSDFERKKGIPEQRITMAWQPDKISVDDMEVISVIRRIGVNLFSMTELIGGGSIG